MVRKCVALCVALLAGAVVPVVPAGAEAPAPERMVPLSPARLMDTRGLPTVDSGGPRGAVLAGTAVDLVVTGRGGVPATGVGAVVLNVTAAGSSAGGYLTVWPTGEARPATSTLNFAKGRAVANLVVAKVGALGSVSVFSPSTTHVVADVTGWFPTGADLGALSPARLMDTRGLRTVDGDGPRGVVPGAGSVDLTVVGRGGVPASGVGSVLLNVTAVGGPSGGFVTVWPQGRTRPLTSNLNFAAGAATANLVAAEVANGKVSLYVSSRAHLVADVVGWMPVDSYFQGVGPARVMDSRGRPTVDGAGPRGALAPGATVDLEVAGRGGVPRTGVGAVVLNVTAARPGAGGYLTVWPTGEARPLASNLNFVGGQAVANLVVAKTGAEGRVSISSPVRTDVVVDVVGWFPTYEPTAVAPGVVAPPAEDVVASAGADPAGNATVTLAAATSPQVGESVVLPPTAEFPSGYLGRVEAVATNPSGDPVVSMSPGFVTDVLPQSSLEVDLDTGVAVLSQGGTVLSRSFALSRAQVSQVARATSRSVSAACSAQAGAGVGVSFEATLGKITFNGDGLRPSTVWAEAYLRPRVAATFNASLTGTAQCELSGALPTINLPTIRTCIPAPVGCIPFFWTHELNVRVDGSVTAEAAASFTAEVGAEAKLGFRVGKGERLYREVDVFARATPNLSVGAEGKVWLHLDYEGKAYGVVGFVAGFGPELDLTLNALSSPWLLAKLRLKGELSGKLDVKLRSWTTPPLTLLIPRNGWELWRIGSRGGSGRQVRDLATGSEAAVPALAPGESAEWTLRQVAPTEKIALLGDRGSPFIWVTLSDAEGNEVFSELALSDRPFSVPASGAAYRVKVDTCGSFNGITICSSLGLAPGALTLVRLTPPPDVSVGALALATRTRLPTLSMGQAVTLPVRSSGGVRQVFTFSGLAPGKLVEVRLYDSSGTDWSFGRLGTFPLGQNGPVYSSDGKLPPGNYTLRVEYPLQRGAGGTVLPATSLSGLSVTRTTERAG